MYWHIDGGTTNTRLYRQDSTGVRLAAAAPVGAGNPAGLTGFVRGALAQFVRAGDTVLASGMIGSEQGLYPMPHLPAPVGIAALHAGIRAATLPDIAPFPLHFIPGVKTAADVMRGEETELYGLETTIRPDAVYLLPGTHTKCIRTDPDGCIADFCTYMTGELLHALHEGTILGRSFSFCEAVDPAYLCRGFECCDSAGINRALFRGRVLDTLCGCSGQEVYSFLLGVVLHDEVRAVAAIPANAYILGGKPELARPERYLLERYYQKSACCLAEDVCACAATVGAIRIYENR